MLQKYLLGSILENVDLENNKVYSVGNREINVDFSYVSFYLSFTEDFSCEPGTGLSEERTKIATWKQIVHIQLH